MSKAELLRRARPVAVKVAVALVLAELLYVVLGNGFIRSGLLADLINRKPEKTLVTWEAAHTILPGVVHVRGFELTSQTLKNQVWLRVERARARFSLVRLAAKTLHFSGVDAADVDFRYRERLDRPPRPGADEVSTPPDPTHWPVIPGLDNPPDPRPEDLYPRKKKKRPWTIAFSGAAVDGPIRVAVNGVSLEGRGSVGGSVTVVPRDEIHIRRGRLVLDQTRVTASGEVVVDDLALTGDLRFEAFPARGAGIADVLRAASGELAIDGQLAEPAAVRHEVTPGISTFGFGAVSCRLNLDHGILRDGSSYRLESDDFRVGLMAIEAVGSGRMSGQTTREGDAHRSVLRAELDEFELVDPENQQVGVLGSGLVLDAEWRDFSFADRAPAARAEVSLPPMQILDVSIFNAFMTPTAPLLFHGGTGVAEGHFEVVDRVAVGTLDVVADDLDLATRTTPLVGDLEVHAVLTEGDLASRSFDLAGTRLRLDDILDRRAQADEGDKVEGWFCELALEHGRILFGQPVAADGSVELAMHDTKPVVVLLRELGAGPKWLGMLPTVKNVQGGARLDLGPGRMCFDEVDLAGDGLEVLGWIHVVDKKADGRIFARYKALKAGISLDEGKSKLVIAKPRKWFDEQGHARGVDE